MKDEFGVVERSNLADELASRILHTIRTRKYKPGDRLPAIMEMARSFGVGHPAVREALKKLEIIGAVEIKHGSGVYVKKGQDVLVLSNPIFSGVVSKDLLLDLIDARIPIEVRSVALASTNATEDHLKRMQELLDEAEQNIEDDAALSRANMAFHQEIAEASGNAVLAQLQEVLTNLFQREQRMILSIYGSREIDHKEHLNILDALRRRNAPLAQARMQAHLEGVRDVLLRWDPGEETLPD